MVLFGENGLFASHLPLYAHPHDHQVVVQLTIADQKLAQGVRQALAGGQQLTLEPERFDLLRLAPKSTEPLRSFKGKLYRGHFERGGDVWQADVVFRVERVLVFRKLLADMPKPELMTYLAFTDHNRTYLVHRIHGRSDFDQILSLQTPRASAAMQKVGLPVTDAQNERIGKGEAAARWLQRKGWRDVRDIYFETTDLK